MEQPSCNTFRVSANLSVDKKKKTVVYPTTGKCSVISKQQKKKVQSVGGKIQIQKIFKNKTRHGGQTAASPCIHPEPCIHPGPCIRLEPCIHPGPCIHPEPWIQDQSPQCPQMGSESHQPEAAGVFSEWMVGHWCSASARSSSSSAPPCSLV